MQQASLTAGFVVPETLSPFAIYISMDYANFKTITLRQYRDLYNIHTSGDSDLDKIMQSVCVLTGKSERQVEEMSLPDFNMVSRELSVIFGKHPEGKPKKHITIAGKQYSIIYDPSKLKAGQYIEIQTWMASNVIENMNKIMASLVRPYDAGNHAKLSEQILDCNFIDVHTTCVFFSLLFKNSIDSLVDYLAKDKSLSRAKITSRELRTLLRLGSDGYSMPKESQTLRT